VYNKATEAWMSGLNQQFTKLSTGKTVREFESHRLRQENKVSESTHLPIVCSTTQIDTLQQKAQNSVLFVYLWNLKHCVPKPNMFFMISTITLWNFDHSHYHVSKVLSIS
jgi:hypothetical protein